MGGWADGRAGWLAGRPTGCLSAPELAALCLGIVCGRWVPRRVLPHVLVRAGWEGQVARACGGGIASTLHASALPCTSARGAPWPAGGCCRPPRGPQLLATTLPPPPAGGHRRSRGVLTLTASGGVRRLVLSRADPAVWFVPRSVHPPPPALPITFSLLPPLTMCAPPPPPSLPPAQRPALTSSVSLSFPLLLPLSPAPLPMALLFPGHLRRRSWRRSSATVTRTTMTTEQHVGRLACHRWQWRGREHSPQVGCVVGGEGRPVREAKG